jgi:hypothetical protein
MLSELITAVRGEIENAVVSIVVIAVGDAQFEKGGV